MDMEIAPTILYRSMQARPTSYEASGPRSQFHWNRSSEYNDANPKPTMPAKYRLCWRESEPPIRALRRQSNLNL